MTMTLMNLLDIECPILQMVCYSLKLKLVVIFFKYSKSSFRFIFFYLFYIETSLNSLKSSKEDLCFSDFDLFLVGFGSCILINLLNSILNTFNYLIYLSNN